jgi:hypothetical protein
MSIFFAKYNLIVVMGNNMKYTQRVAKTIQLTFKPNAIFFTGNVSPPFNLLKNIQYPLIFCRSKYPLDSDFLDNVREHDGLIVWTYKSRFHNARDLFIADS